MQGSTMLLHISVLPLFFLRSEIKCQALPQPPNGNISYSKSPYKNRVDWNEQANYTCDQGFEIEGNKTRTCGYPTTKGGLGQWSPERQPSCVGECWLIKKKRPRVHSHDFCCNVTPSQLGGGGGGSIERLALRTWNILTIEGRIPPPLIWVFGHFLLFCTMV